MILTKQFDQNRNLVHSWQGALKESSMVFCFRQRHFLFSLLMVSYLSSFSLVQIPILSVPLPTFLPSAVPEPRDHLQIQQQWEMLLGQTSTYVRRAKISMVLKLLQRRKQSFFLLGKVIPLDLPIPDFLAVLGSCVHCFSDTDVSG